MMILQHVEHAPLQIARKGLVEGRALEGCIDRGRVRSCSMPPQVRRPGSRSLRAVGCRALCGLLPWSTARALVGQGVCPSSSTQKAPKCRCNRTIKQRHHVPSFVPQHGHALAA
eukprot:scaffold56724_cov67-Phaeocystis_antarctica.AAC.3